MRPWSPDGTEGLHEEGGLHKSGRDRINPSKNDISERPENDGGNEDSVDARRRHTASAKTSRLLSYEGDNTNMRSATSHKNSRTIQPRNKRSSRDAKRISNIIGKEFTFQGNPKNGHLVAGSRVASTSGMSAGSSNISAKIWIEDNPPRDIDKNLGRRSQHNRSSSNKVTRPNLSSREMPFENQKFEAVLFSRETLSSAKKEGTFEMSSSPIAAHNVVSAKRANTRLTAGVFKQKVDWLSSDSSKMPRYAEKRGRKIPRTESRNPDISFSSKRRQPERLRTPLAGSGLMGVAAEMEVQESEKERRRQRAQVAAQLRHPISDKMVNSEAKSLSSTEHQSQPVLKNVMAVVGDAYLDQKASLQPMKNTVPDRIEVVNDKPIAKPTVTMKVNAPTNNNITIHKSRIRENLDEEALLNQPTHPGQASFLGEIPPSRSKAALSKTVLRPSHRDDGVPFMGEYYKSQTQTLGALERAIKQVPMASPKLSQSTVVPTNNPHKKTLKKQSAHSLSKKKRRKKAVPNHDNNDAALRPAGWKAPMFMLPVKTSATLKTSMNSFSRQNADAMTPRSKRYVNSLGGQGLLRATERALQRNRPNQDYVKPSDEPIEEKETPAHNNHDDESKNSSHSALKQHEESANFSQFKTVQTATKFWLQHMLREHNLRRGVTSDLSTSKEGGHTHARPSTPAVKNLSQFLSSAIEHIRWSCTAAGWSAPQQQELERRVYNVVLDELTNQVATHNTSRGTLFSIVATHYHEVLGQTLPSLLAAKEDMMEELRKEVEELQMKNRHLQEALRNGEAVSDDEEIDPDHPHAHLTAADRLASQEQLKNELAAARQVIKARDAEQNALRRRGEHFRRDLQQAEVLAKQQREEMVLIRETMRKESESARKSVEKSNASLAKLRTELTQALSKVVHAENMEKIRLEEDLEGKLSRAEERCKVMEAERDAALAKARAASRSEHVLYSKIKDMEEEKVGMNREIVSLKRFKEMMNEMMGKVETVRRASIAIRHKIPVSKLSGDPAVMQEVVNRMTAKVVEMETALEEVTEEKQKIKKRYDVERQKCVIQSQQVIDARGAQTKAEASLLELHQEFSETVSSTRATINDLRETISNLESENEYLMEQAMNAAADVGSGESSAANGSGGGGTGNLSKSQALALQSRVGSVRLEYRGIRQETELFLNDFGDMINGIKAQIDNIGRVNKRSVALFADAILYASQANQPKSSPIDRRRSLIKRRAKAEVRKKIQRRRASMEAVEKAVKSEAKESPEEIAASAAAAAKEAEKKEEGLIAKEEERLAVEDTDEFQLAIKMAQRTMDRERRQLEAQLRQMKHAQKVAEKEANIHLLELQGRLEHLEHDNKRVTEAHEELVSSQENRKAAENALLELEEILSKANEEMAVAHTEEKNSHSALGILEAGDDKMDGEDPEVEKARERHEAAKTALASISAGIASIEERVSSAREALRVAEEDVNMKMSKYRQEEKSDENIARVMREIEDFRQEQKNSAEARTAASLRRRLSHIDLKMNDNDGIKNIAKQAIVEAHGQYQVSEGHPEQKSGYSALKNILQKRRSLAENKETEVEKRKLVLIQKQQAEAQANSVSETQAKIDSIRQSLIETNPNLELLEQKIVGLEARESDLSMTLEELQKEETESEIKEQKAKIQATMHRSELAKLERKLKRAQIKVDMKKAIEERRKAAGISGDDNGEEAERMEAKLAELDEESDDDDDDDEDGDEDSDKDSDDDKNRQLSVEEDLEHIQSLFNEAQNSWQDAEERLKRFHGIALANKRKIQVQKSRKMELEQEIERAGREREREEAQCSQELSQAKADLKALVSEEASLWEDIRTEESALEILEAEVAEQEKEEEEKTAREAALKAAAETGAEVSIETVTLADGTTQQVIRVIEKRDADAACQTDPVLFGRGSGSSSDESNDSKQTAMILSALKLELKEMTGEYRKTRDSTALELQKMGWDLRKFAKGLGKQLGMKLDVKTVEVKKQAAPKPRLPGGGSSRMQSMMTQMKQKRIQNIKPIETVVEEEELEPEVPISPTPKPRRGTGADWIANKAGRLKEFEAVQKKMAEAMKQMSEEQVRARHAAATKIQAMCRSHANRYEVSVIRAQRQREAEAKQRLMHMKNSPTGSHQGSPAARSGLWSRIDDIDDMVVNLERGTVNEGMGEDTIAWGEQGNPNKTPSKSNKMKLTIWDKENLMKMKKRVMKLERRVREVARLLVDAARSGHVKTGQTHASEIQRGNSAIGRPRFETMDGKKFDGATTADEGQRSAMDTSGRYASDTKASEDEDNLDDSEGEEDFWPMSRPSWMNATGAAPALPGSHASNKNMLPGGISVDKWREQRGINTYRVPYGGRKRKYRLNREYFRSLINIKKRDDSTKIRDERAFAGGVDGDWQAEESANVASLDLHTSESKDVGENQQSKIDTNKQPRAVSWVVKMIRQIYEDKLSAEGNSFRNGFQAPTMVEYLSEWASTRYGMPVLVEQMCWDLYHSVQLYREYSLEIDTFARFVDEEASSEELSFYLFTRSMALNAVGEPRTSKIELHPVQLPLSHAVDIVTRVLKHTPAAHQMELLFRLDQSALPERPMNDRLKLDISGILNRGKKGSQAKSEDGDLSNSTTYERYFKNIKNSNIMKTDKQQQEDDKRALLQLKERLISWSPNVLSASGEREVDLERFLYLCCRSFRSAQRRFKRKLKKVLKNGVHSNDSNLMGESERNLQRRYVSKNEFAEATLSVVEGWSREEVIAIFKQGQNNLARKHEKEGIVVSSLASRLKVSDLISLAVQMWSHVMLLPHAQVGTHDGNTNISLERRLQTLLGAVSSHWPSFEPMLHRVANRIGNAVQQSHAVGVPLDQGQMALKTSSGFLSEKPPVAHRPHDHELNAKSHSLPETLRYKKFNPSEKGRRHVKIPAMSASFVPSNQVGAELGMGSGSGW